MRLFLLLRDFRPKRNYGMGLRCIRNRTLPVLWGGFCYAEYTGYVLYNPESREYGVALDYSLWYGDNKYDINGYGKFVSLPMDNGAKLELEILTPINEAV